MKKLLILLSILLLLLSACSKKIKLTCGISELSQVGINHIQPVIEALEKYKKDNGKYPKNALELIPKYIDKVPIIINTNESIDDKTKYNALILEKVRGGVPWIPEGENYFEIKFYSEDDRFCLLGGRNNICEYTTQKLSWNCHQ